MKRLLALVGAVVDEEPQVVDMRTAPTPTPSTTQTRIITGDLAFGEVNIGSTADRAFTINNSGNATRSPPTPHRIPPGPPRRA